MFYSYSSLWCTQRSSSRGGNRPASSCKSSLATPRRHPNPGRQEFVEIENQIKTLMVFVASLVVFEISHFVNSSSVLGFVSLLGGPLAGPIQHLAVQIGT